MERPSSTNQSLVHVWDLATSKEVFAIELPYGSHNTDLAVSPDGMLLATAGNDGLRLWNLFTGELLVRLLDQGNEVALVAFNRAGTLLSSVDYDGTIRIWRIEEY